MRHDVLIAVRTLVKRPAYAMSVVATLTVGLGTFAVVYTAVDKILIEPLPYPRADDLYTVWAEVDYLNVRHAPMSGPNVAELQKAGGIIESAAAVRCGLTTLAASPSAEASRLFAMAPTVRSLLTPEAWSSY